MARRETVSRPRRLVLLVATHVGRAGLTVYMRVCGGGLDGPCGGLRFENHHRARALPWLPSGTGDDDAPGRRFLLEDVVEVMFFAS